MPPDVGNLSCRIAQVPLYTEIKPSNSSASSVEQNFVDSIEANILDLNAYVI